ncbi:MAG: transcription antitermination protein NusB [Candidatus Roizmanbacteria bacterium]|nr:transcription antitermination protein NusB [Candidatus Roizmanbacteria bacterium]
MKKSSDPRHINRQRILEALYSCKFEGTRMPRLKPDQKKVLEDINSFVEKIDTIIDSYALTFSHAKMSKIDYSLLQLGIYELFFSKISVPYKVSIDECVELAKEFGSEKSPKLINGILAKAQENEQQPRRA